jgi:hypothetical protein
MNIVEFALSLAKKDPELLAEIDREIELEEKELSKTNDVNGSEE